MAKKKHKPAAAGRQNAPAQKPGAAAAEPEKKSSGSASADAPEKRGLFRRKSDGEKQRPYTLIDCMKLGRLGNVLFILFIIVCLIYYYSFARKGTFFIPFEVIAYGIEAAGFALFTTSVIWIDRLVRARTLMKVLLIVYIAVEVVLMLLEFQFLPWTYFGVIHYNGISAWTVTLHAIFSGGTAFSLLMLEPHNKRLEIIVGITCGMMLAGMLFVIPGYRVYASILLNAAAYIFFFTALKRQLVLEEVLVDCYGDQAKVTSFSSTLFADTPDLVEKEKQSVGQRVRSLRNKLSLENEEKLVLTDKDEKFEYEFGVVDDDGDDDDGGDEA